LKAIGINLEENGKREDPFDSVQRLEKWSNLLFVYLRDDCYIGRAWQYLTIYVNMKFVQQTCQILVSLIHMTGDRLLFSYRPAFKRIL